VTPYQADLAYIHATGFSALAHGAAPEIIRRLLAASAHRVLDVGCGSGALTMLLIEAGFDVTGIDPSPDPLALARAAAPAARFVQGSVYDIELPGCDAILAIGEPLTYHDDLAAADSRVERFFRSAAAALRPGGLLIFDIIETGEPSLAGRSWASGEDWAVLVETHEEQSARTLTRDIQTFRRVADLYRRGHEVHNVRLFDAAALCRALTDAGFSVETAQSYGAHALAPRRRAFFAVRQAGSLRRIGNPPPSSGIKA
jgi:SAM-dependent methyltransferase